MAWAADAVRREGRVQWVIDGDTFQLYGGERVRLIGVNAPEYQPHKQKAEPFGRQASEFAIKLLAGKKVIIEEDAQPQDKYARTLAYIYLEDGTFVNQLMVERGLARARYYAPNGRHRLKLNAAEKSAKASGVGLWGDASA